jgi:DNA-binding beta-propeller fold protein YncE
MADQRKESGMDSEGRARWMAAAIAWALIASLLHSASSAAAMEPRGKPGQAASVRFTSPPQATPRGHGAELRFAVSAVTDVEVAVVDAKGNVIRRLAAGMLGRNAPPPLKRNSLRQDLRWDGTDDDGEPVKPGSYAFRVRCGVEARFDRVLGFDPWAIRHVQGMAVDAQGALYVLSNGSLGVNPALRVFSREGKYLRTLLPPRADLAAAEKAELGFVEVLDGATVPRMGPDHHGFPHLWLPDTARFGRQTMAVTRDGRLLLLNGPMRDYRLHPLRILVLGTNGHLRGSYLGPRLSRGAGELSYGPGHLALSPDDRFAYVSGLRRSGKCHHVVYRVTLKEEGPPKPFLGEPFKPGDDEAHLNDPRGIATDAKGNLYVADYGNDRIVVSGPQGKRLGSVAVDRPDQIAVHPASGAIYVLSVEAEAPHMRATRHTWKDKQLLKISGWRDGRIVARLQLPDHPRSRTVMAVDKTAKPSLVYVANLRQARGGMYPEDGLWRLRDEGTSFSEPQEVASYDRGGMLAGCWPQGESNESRSTRSSDPAAVHCAVTGLSRFE